MGVELTKNMRGEVKLPSKQQAMEYHVEKTLSWMEIQHLTSMIM